MRNKGLFAHCVQSPEKGHDQHGGYLGTDVDASSAYDTSAIIYINCLQQPKLSSRNSHMSGAFQTHIHGMGKNV